MSGKKKFGMLFNIFYFLFAGGGGGGSGWLIGWLVYMVILISIQYFFMNGELMHIFFLFLARGNAYAYYLINWGRNNYSFINIRHHIISDTR